MTLRSLYEISGAVTRTRRRRAWQRAWRLHGPLIPLALGLGLLAGSAIVVVVRAEEPGQILTSKPPEGINFLDLQKLAMAPPTEFRITTDANQTMMRIDLKAHTIWVNPKLRANTAAKAMLQYMRTMNDWCAK